MVSMEHKFGWRERKTMERVVSGVHRRPRGRLSRHFIMSTPCWTCRRKVWTVMGKDQSS